MSHGSKPPSPKPNLFLTGGVHNVSKNFNAKKSGSQSPNIIADGGGKLSQKAPAIAPNHFEMDDHSFLSLSQQQDADGLRFSPNCEPQMPFEPNSSIFSSSRSVADAAAKHPSLLELVHQQKMQRAQEVPIGKHGSISQFGHGKEKALFATLEKPEKDRDRNMSLVSCSSESTSLTDCGAADVDDCTSSDKTISAGYMPSVHHSPHSSSHGSSQLLPRDETSMSDEELLRFQNQLLEGYMRTTQELERRKVFFAAAAAAHTHSVPAAAAVGTNEKQPNQPTKLLSAVQSMHSNAKQQLLMQQQQQQQQQLLMQQQQQQQQQLQTPLPHYTSFAGHTAPPAPASALVDAPRATAVSRLPQSQSPPVPPAMATASQGPGPRSKGIAPVAVSSASNSAALPPPTKPSCEHAEVTSNAAPASTDSKNVRVHKQRSLSGGSESGFAAATAAAAQKLTQSTASHQPHRSGGGQHDLPEDEELVAYMESQQQSQSGRTINTPNGDMASQHMHGSVQGSRTSHRGGAVPPTEKMFAAVSASPASSTQYSRSATPANYGPRLSSHSPFDAAAQQPAPPQRSHSSTPSASSRPHSRMSSASGGTGAGVVPHDEASDSRPHSRAANGIRGSTPSGRLRKQKPLHSNSPNIEGFAPASQVSQVSEPVHSFPPQLRGRQASTSSSGRTASKDKDRSASPGTALSLTASTVRTMEATEQDRRTMRSLAQQTSYPLVCVPKNLPLQQPRCVKTRSRALPSPSSDDFSIAQDCDGSVAEKSDSELGSVCGASATVAGGLDRMFNCLRTEQEQQHSRDNLVPSPFSAFDELSQGSQSLSSNLSLSKQRPHRAAAATSSDGIKDCRGSKPSRAAAVAENNGKKPSRLRKDT